jgi:hypothetical protein
MAFDASHLFPGLVGGLIAAAINYLGLRWRYRTDELANFWARTCEDIAAAADLATEYWLKDLSKTAGEGEQDVLKTEFRIIGYQQRLSEMTAILEEEAQQIDLLSLRPLFADFFDALSGGNFQVPERRHDHRRARSVQDIGARLIVRLRSALRRRTRLW